MYAEELVQVGPALFPRRKPFMAGYCVRTPKVVRRPRCRGRTWCGGTDWLWRTCIRLWVSSSMTPLIRSGLEATALPCTALTRRFLPAGELRGVPANRQRNGRTDGKGIGATDPRQCGKRCHGAGRCGGLSGPAGTGHTHRARHSPAAPQTGLGFLGTVAAFALGLGAGDALFGDD